MLWMGKTDYIYLKQETSLSMTTSIMSKEMRR